MLFGGVLRFLGVGGFRGGFLLAAAILVGGGTLTAMWGLAGVPQRTTWLVAVGLLGLIIAGLLVDQAPISKGRLRAEAARVDLDFYRLEREITSGNSRCDPCPTVERRYVGPDLIVDAALIEVAARLASAGYPLRVTEDARRSGRLRTATEDIRVDVEVRRVDDATDVRLTFRGA